MPRLKRLEVVGFRAFGSTCQALDFEKNLAVIYAPNSHGKTSLAEAIEFLLTGATSRRSLVGSAVREFADALRNAHLVTGGEVVVRGIIETLDGRSHLVERKLLTDYTARGDCASELRIDGQNANDVTSLGIALAQPPLAAPVLMPHGLRYVLQVEPTQRTTYFKMLLEMGDLDEVRRRIAGLQVETSSSTKALLAKHTECANNRTFGSALSSSSASSEDVRAKLGDALRLAAGSPTDLPDDLDGRIAHLRAVLTEKQGTAFPIDALAPGPAVGWTRPATTAFDDVLAYRRLRETIDAELARVQALYTTLLEIPAYAELRPPASTTCPVCKTNGALTGHRIEEIRSALNSSEAVTKARVKATTALRAVQESVTTTLRGVSAMRPQVFGWSVEERERRGFSTEALTTLLGDGAVDCVTEWKDAANHLRPALKDAEAGIKTHEATISELRVETFDEETASRAATALDAIDGIVRTVATARSRYVAAHKAVTEAIEPAVARKTNTEGWRTLLALAANPDALVAALREEAAVQATRADHEAALGQIDKAIGEVLDAKYEQLGGDVATWWRLMRPDTTTRFSGLQRAGTGRRFLDIKAGLFEGEARPEPTAIRDAVAVFSDSQLNCLGLAAFLARAVRQKAGFIVLDDPFPGSDADHRTMFLDQVLPALAAEGIQVVLLTHDDHAARDAQAMYADTGVDTFEIGLADPVAGAAVTRTSDDLDLMLSKANGLLVTSSSSSEGRKLAAKHLRAATERFCKLTVIKARAAQGTVTPLSDLNLTLGVLVPMVEPLLTQNPGDPGKLRVIPGRINPGNHDDAVPEQADLKQTYGTLKDFKKRYLA